MIKAENRVKRIMIQAQIDEETLKKVKMKAAYEGKTIRQLINQLLEEYLEDWNF